MSALHHRLISWSYWPVSAARVIGRPLGLSASNRLRVLLYHDVAPESESRFEAQLRWLSRRWTFVTPDRFAAMVSGDEPVRGANLLLSFDDGLASNRIVAEKILGPMGIRAMFFAVSDLVAIDDRQAARDFIVGRKIVLDRTVDQLPPHVENMRWADLEALLEQGHLIGGHTRTHARLSEVTTPAALEHEIAASADVLSSRLGAPIEHFAYTFGNIASFSEDALAVARRRFKFVYSGLRGDNAHGVSPIAIRRDAVTAEDANTLVGAFVEGTVDPVYAKSNATLDGWV